MSDPGPDEFATGIDVAPCPCFLFEDDGANSDTCECGHTLDQHITVGVPSPRECAFNHRLGCPLDHGDGPCPP